MNRDEIKKLLQEIVKVYPRFECNQYTIDAWAKRLGDYTLKKALSALDMWIAGDKGSYSPDLSYFVKKANERATTSNTLVDKGHHHFDLERGRDGKYRFDKNGRAYSYYLVDEEGREYGNTLCEPYYFDKMGRIVRKDETGREIVIVDKQ